LRWRFARMIWLAHDSLSDFMSFITLFEIETALTQIVNECIQDGWFKRDPVISVRARRAQDDLPTIE